MKSYFAEILSSQERKFKNCIMRDFLSFNKRFEDKSGFPFLKIMSREYEVQKFFETRIEHYVRNILINDVLRLLLEDKGVGIYTSEISDKNLEDKCFYTNAEYEKKAGYEFIADYDEETVMYRYTDVTSEDAERLLSDFENKLIILDWNHLAKTEERCIALSNGKKLQYSSLYQLFKEKIGIEEYQDFITFLAGVIIEYQEFIGVKSTPKLSPFSLGRFRFEVENNLKKYTEKIRDYMKSEDKINSMNLSDAYGVDYGYRVIDDENKEKYGKAEKASKDLLRNSETLNEFDEKRLYRFLIGGADFAKSLITSEYLYKQYDCDDCFDYTAIVSGYLKSVEQLLYHIAFFSKDKGYKIKNNGQKNKQGVYPASVKIGKVYKIDFVKENDGCFDTTIGSLIHFLDDNKADLLLCEDIYKKVIIDCLNCYRVECRNDSFHLDNNYNWSRVELIRWNTFLIYILLLSCCKLGDTDWKTKQDLQFIEDDRLERLYDIIASGKEGLFEFVFMGNGYLLEPIKARHVTAESSYPSYDTVGQIKSVLLTFESITDHQKMIIMRGNVPEEMYFIDENGNKTKIE